MGEYCTSGGIRRIVCKIQTKVRYRLLFLTSMPVFITMLALVMITIYWATHYTWQDTLNDVAERLKTAENQFQNRQNMQVENLYMIGESYLFRQELLHSSGEKELNIWLQDHEFPSLQKHQHIFDCLRWQSVNRTEAAFLTHPTARVFYQVLESSELQDWCESAVSQAIVPIHQSGSQETRALVSRALYPVYAEDGTLQGYLDSILLLNNNQQIVDDIRDQVYPEIGSYSTKTGAVTIFLNDLRISTNILIDDYNPESRAVGTRVSPIVRQTVLEDGDFYLDRAYVHNTWYASGYKPLRDLNDSIIGMLYVGHQIWPLLEAYLINLGEIALMIISVLLLSAYIVHFGTRDLFHPIEKISSVVQAIQQGQDKRIGDLALVPEHELANLAKQFDQMLDLLAFRNQQIKQATAELETKVSERTASLHDKTIQLEHHIKLLNQTRDKLIVSEKLAALGQLTAGIAHEINNPVAVILGNVELIQMELGDRTQDIEEELVVIFEQIKRIRNITQSLLQYSRSGADKELFIRQDINSIVVESITLVKTGSKRKDVTFYTEYTATEFIECSRNQLLQVLINLLVNAVQSMAERGTITVRTENWYENSELKGSIIHIQDEGCGIKEEDLSKLFDPFYTTKPEGTGLGLSVSQGLLHRIGGEMRVSSASEKGTCFSLHLHTNAQFS
ncbi:two-component sensor histidine kinase [Vibrio sp. HA2012]|uniref:sensor histidine kinase n=1 Tax=Vibrio sp. HA2012 TaxID=1971595 RepID=UPI000C2C25AA|nr:cache domain-containing protein [Vibrio sp. HA2012]PJC87930.1 two-component sensor histidine kinase [Vibrio sp. HA2012]